MRSQRADTFPDLARGGIWPARIERAAEGKFDTVLIGTMAHYLCDLVENVDGLQTIANLESSY